MKKCLTISLLAVCAIFTSSSTFAQQWNDAEQEVWQAVLDCTNAFIEKNETANQDCFHEDYSFWWSEDVLPFGKELVRNFQFHFLETNKTAFADLRPAAIKVYGNTALVQWGQRGFMKDENGDPEDIWVERISMMLVKENGKWRYYGGGGSPFKK